MVNTKSKPFFPVAGLFVFLGMNTGSWVSQIVNFKISMAITDAQLGFFLLAASAGAISAFPLTVYMLKRNGPKFTALLLSTVLLLLLPVLMVNDAYHVGIALMFIEGACCAGLNASMNMLGSGIERQYKFKCMSRLHATFSLGFAFSALIAMGFMNFISEDLLFYGLFMSGLLFAITVLNKLNLRDLKILTVDNNAAENKLFTTVTLILGAIVFSSSVIEGAINDWSAVYLSDVIGIDRALSPSGVFVFSIAVFTGRLFADLLRDKYSDQWLILIAGLCVWIALSLGVYNGGLYASWLAFALVGLTIALVTPSIYATAALSGPGCLSLVAVFGSGGGLFGPPMIGFIAQYYVLDIGMYVVALYGLIISALAITLIINEKTTIPTLSVR